MIVRSAPLLLRTRIYATNTQVEFSLTKMTIELSTNLSPHCHWLRLPEARLDNKFIHTPMDESLISAKRLCQSYYQVDDHCDLL